MYHHGEVNLGDTIINMAQNFVGSNNLNLFRKDGQFGSRADGGEFAAAGRYSQTCPEWWLEYVFDKEMVTSIAKREVEDGYGEPLWIPCDIPLGIINGNLGVATGWSSCLLPHNPFDVIKALIDRSKGIPFTPLIPWFNNFKGLIEIKQKGILPEVEVNENIEGEFDRRKNEIEQNEPTPVIKIDNKKSLVTKGIFEIIKTHPNGTVDVEIKDLPVGRWIHKYYLWLESLVADKLLGDFDNNSTSEIPHFFLYKLKLDKVDIDTLKLKKTYGMSNMVMIDDNGFPKHYDNTSLILEEYYQNMLQLYEEIKIKKLNELVLSIQELKHCITFITLVNNGQILVLKKKKVDVHAQMEQYQIPKNVYGLIKLEECNDEGIENLNKKVIKQTEEYTELFNTASVQIWMNKLVKFNNELIKRKYGQ
jgi:DNA topoisomerase-2